MYTDLIYLYNILSKMLQIETKTIKLEDSSPFFAYRRILGLEKQDRVRCEIKIEREFTEMYPKGKLSDVINQALNQMAVQQGLIK